MSCITKGNTRCTKCCEAIHINRNQYHKAKRGLITLVDQAYIFKYWTPISKRRAKRINPHVNTQGQWAQYFTCKALVLGVGCSIRDSEEHPKVCKIFTGGDCYSPTCDTDINMIARSTE